MYYKIVFSPTGGTDKVATLLMDGVDDQFQTIDLSDPHFDATDVEFTSDDRAVIAMPCFGGRVPAVAVERLKTMKGNGARCAVVCVYGNRAFEDGLLEMADAAKAAGFKVTAGIAAIAEHSIMHQYAAGRPDQVDAKNLADAAVAVSVALNADPLPVESAIPGNNPYKKAGAVGLVPSVDKNCIQCGKCAENCPVEAIEYGSFKASKDECISCMRCISICPVQARHINKLMVSVAAMAIKKEAETRKEVEVFV